MALCQFLCIFAPRTLAMSLGGGANSTHVGTNTGDTSVRPYVR